MEERSIGISQDFTEEWDVPLVSTPLALDALESSDLAELPQAT